MPAPATASSNVPPPIATGVFTTPSGQLTPSGLDFMQTMWSALFGTGGTIIQSGTILAFGGSSAPAGYLLCDGTAYPQVDFPNLYAAIGNSWGSAAAGMFLVPNGMDKFFVGAGTNALGSTGGNFKQTIEQANLPAVDLTFSSTNTYNPGTVNLNQTDIAQTGGATTGATGGGGGTYTNGTGITPTVTIPSFTPAGIVPLGGSGTELDTTPPFFAGNWIIKT